MLNERQKSGRDRRTATYQWVTTPLLPDRFMLAPSGFYSRIQAKRDFSQSSPWENLCILNFIALYCASLVESDANLTTWLARTHKQSGVSPNPFGQNIIIRKLSSKLFFHAPHIILSRDSHVSSFKDMWYYWIVLYPKKYEHNKPFLNQKISFSFKGFSSRHTRYDAVLWWQNVLLRGATASSGEEKYLPIYLKTRCNTSICYQKKKKTFYGKCRRRWEWFLFWEITMIYLKVWVPTIFHDDHKVEYQTRLQTKKNLEPEE